MKNSQHAVRISNGTSQHRGRVQNREISWSKFVDRLSNPQVDANITMSQYEAFGKQAKGSTKAAAGFFFAGHCKDGVRTSDSVEFRSMINLDIDDVEDDEIFTQIRMGVLEDLEFEAFAHTTRSHTRAKPRVRIMIPLVKDIYNAEEYNAVSRLVAERIDISMKSFDTCSFRLAQMMYMPSKSADQEFIAKRFTGSLCDPDLILEECEGDWRDLANLPRAMSEKVQIRRLVNALGDGENSGQLSDPAEKQGIVGAFCRAYCIESAMSALMPGVYTQSIGRGAAPNRFTYAAGSSVNGAVLLNGTHLYSHHATDPLREQALNAWDLVRAHRFGHLDNPDFEYNSPAEKESQKAMIAYANSDPRVKAEIAKTRVSADEFDI